MLESLMQLLLPGLRNQQGTLSPQLMFGRSSHFLLNILSVSTSILGLIGLSPCMRKDLMGFLLMRWV